mmetsp:Transcript_4366/g.4518  ORF Transcript_4366/g.4518 Transcript_4366/m.4518 type:complete len:337 (+) Transcript_4366:60-1070(+)
MNAQAQLKKLKKADKLAITKLTTHELMNNAQWAHIPEAHRSQAIQMALMTTDATSGCMCHCEIAKKLKESGIINDSKEFMQRVLRTIDKNTTFQNGTEYIMDTEGPPIKKKRDGSYTHIKGGKLLIPITMLHNFLLGGQFPLLNEVVQVYVACHHVIASVKTRFSDATANFLDAPERTTRKDTRRGRGECLQDLGFGMQAGIGCALDKDILNLIVPGPGSQRKKRMIARGESSETTESAMSGLNPPEQGCVAFINARITDMIKKNTARLMILTVQERKTEIRRICREFLVKWEPIFGEVAYEGTYEENAYKCYNKQYAISQQESANAANGARGLLN